MSHVKTCQAQCAGCGVGACIAPNTLAAAFDQVYFGTIAPGLIRASQIMDVYLQTAVNQFDSVMGRVMPWETQQLTDWFDTFWFYNLQPAMQDMGRELTSADVEQTFSLGSFVDATNVDRCLASDPNCLKPCPPDEPNCTVKQILDLKTNALKAISTQETLEDMGLEDQRTVRPTGGVCTAATMMGNMERATGFSDAYNAASAAGKLWRSANNYNMPSHGGFALDMSFRWLNYDPLNNPQGFVGFWCNPFYNNGSTTLGSPNFGAAGCIVPGKYVGKDVDVAGMVFAQDTINFTSGANPACTSKCNGPNGYNDPQCIANVNNCTSDNKTNLDEMITNLAEPFAKDPVTADPNHGGKAALLASVSYKTKRQIVYDGLDYVISRRVPAGLNYTPEKMSSLEDGLTIGPPAAKSFVQLLTEVRDLTGEGSNTGCGGVGGQPCASPDPSREEILRALITQRFRSGQYSLSQIDEPENNEREMVIQQALQLMQMSDQLDIMDHEMLLLASQVSTEVEHEHALYPAAEGAPLQ